jgi:hypothetical protein
MAADDLATRFTAPYPTQAPPAFWIDDPVIETMAAGLRKHPSFRNCAVTLVNLSQRTRNPDGSGFIKQTGWNGGQQRFAASLVKIAAMFAAYQLRHNLELAMNEVASDDRKDTVETIERDWKDVVRGSVDGAADFPQIDKIFQISGTMGQWTVDFNNEYRRHLIAMIEHSNNHSASVCIDRVGFQYINGALEAAGLYSRDTGGIWLGANYAGRNWRKEPRTGNTHMGATSDAVGLFLTLLESDLLVSPKYSRKMRELMQLAGTWFGEGLSQARPKRPIEMIYGKVGLTDLAHDCAVVQRTQNGHAVRYAAVCLTASSGDVIRRLALKLDDFIVASVS